MTDYLNSPERTYLPLTNVEIMSLDGPPRRERRAFIALSIRHIVLAMPADGRQQDEWVERRNVG